MASIRARLRGIGASSPENPLAAEEEENLLCRGESRTREIGNRLLPQGCEIHEGAVVV